MERDTDQTETNPPIEKTKKKQRFRGKGRKAIARINAIEKEMEEVVIKENFNGPICSCNRTKCLQMYCECFSAGFYCGVQCNCMCCHNTEENEGLVRKKRAYVKKRNFAAFDEVKKDKRQDSCTCTKSNCIQGYCVCYINGKVCDPAKCKCTGCKNDKVIEKDENKI